MIARPIRLPLPRTSIALIVSVALAAVVTLVLVTFALLYHSDERARRFADLRQQLDISADQLALAAALPTWNFDDNQIAAIMKSGLHRRDLYAGVLAASANKRVYVLVRNASGQLVAAEKLPLAPDLLVATRSVTVAGQAIGMVSVYATPRFVIEDLRQHRIAIAGVIVVLDIALVLSVYLLLWQLMLKPIRAVGQYAASVAAGGAAPVPHKAWFLGEIRTLNESIRDMISLLDSRYAALSSSEERLTIATHAANIGIWDWDVVTNELVWDDAMYVHYRVLRNQFGGTMDAWRACVLPADIEHVNRSMMAALGDDGAFDCEFRIVWPDGAIRHMAWESVTFRDESGRPLRMVGVNYDVTDAKMVQQELLHHRNHLEELVAERTAALSVAVTQAEAANRAKSVFLATMSHELRTPLNSVIGFSGLMADSSTMSGDERHNVAIIHRAGQHLLTLINDILELSKIEAGKLTLHCEPVDPVDLLREVVDMVRTRSGQSPVDITLDCAGLPDAVRADAAKLRQVLLNLMSNAVKFVAQGSVTLEVRGTPLPDGGHVLAFKVRDDGVGIAPGDQERIFEPFVQASDGGAKDGTGLGLTISREFVRLMGGELRVASELGVGSEFSFSIKVGAARAVAPAVSYAMPTLSADQRGKRILVVDDNHGGRKLLVALLAPLGFTVTEAADGESGLEAVAALRPDLVFMDWRMPGMDGLEATRRLRSRGGAHQPRVVMLTASAFEEEKQQALAAGADSFLRKPIEHDKLFQTLEQQLGLEFNRKERMLPPAVSQAITAEDMRRLAPSLRAGLRAAMQELDLGRVGQLLDTIDAAHAALAGVMRGMLAQHRYPQLCGLIDEVDGAPSMADATGGSL